MKHLVALLLALLGAGALAQNATVVQQGTAFGNSIAPTSAFQLVNPAAVNAAAWGPAASAPTSVPLNLGGFSAPTTSNSTYTSAQSLGLSNLGSQAVVNCANYVAGPNSSPLQTQACAAVNFLTNNCMTPTPQQAQIIGNLGFNQTPTGNCAGTYGQGVQNFNLQSQVTPTDPMFTVVNNLKTTAAAAASPTCTVQTVVTQPAQYAQNTCTVSSDMSVQACSQYLNISVSTTATVAIATESCPIGVLVGTYCQATTSGAATTTYVCPVGFTLSGTTCTESTSSPATPIYSCPAGETLSGSDCITSTNTTVPATVSSYACPAGQTLSGTTCSGTITQPATIASYACPTGQTLVGTTCQTTTDTVTGSAASTLSCPAGYTISGSNCVSSITTTPVNPNQLMCPNGVLVGSMCKGTTAANYGQTYPPIDMSGCPLPTQMDNGTGLTPIGIVNGGCEYQGTGYGGKFCPLLNVTGWVLQGATPYSSTYATQTTGICDYLAPPVYTCPPGATLDVNNNCVGSTTTVAVVTSYACPNGGTLTNSGCIQTLSATATISYSCPAGQTVVGTNCTQTITTSNPATPVYSCPAGYTVSGSSCSQSITSPATPVYTCPTGETLSGSDCIGTNNTTSPATLSSYTCPSGQTLTGSTCTQIINSPAAVTYTCPAGSTLSGSNCLTTTTTPATTTYSCVDGSAPVNGACLIRTVQQSWTDGCVQYETSSGTTLPTP